MACSPLWWAAFGKLLYHKEQHLLYQVPIKNKATSTWRDRRKDKYPKSSTSAWWILGFWTRPSI